jgi:hypothetical protein
MIYLALPLLFPFVEAGLVITMILNNGTVPTTEGNSCNSDDMKLIKKLLGMKDDSRLLWNPNKQGTRDRDLRYAAKCKANCLGYATGTCLAKDCVGYRRNRQERTLRQSITNHVRELDNALDNCGKELVKMNKDIEKLLLKLSGSCKPIIQSQRNLKCFDDVLYAMIESFTLWDATTDTVIKENVKSGDTFCYSNNTFNIEAVANACVDKVDFRLQGPIIFNDDAKDGPFTIFGLNEEDDFNGKILPIGSYTLYTELKKSIYPPAPLTFTIKKC